jgi:glycosyltransferase involved in cell wall biosynthesis
VISIVICTFNQDRILRETVASFMDCRSDGIDYELLVVDNNSTDGTRGFTERLAAHDSHLKYIFEPSQGLSYARNSGIRASKGESIVFVDDDVYFSPNWLTALASTLERRVEVACIGGKVMLHFDSGQPNWIDDDILWIYGITRYDDHERELQFPEIPRGGNMAFRRTVFEQIGIFHTSLGRKGKNLLSCEDNHLFLRIAKAGMKTIYSPDVQISHRIPASKTTRKWILKRYYWEGISEVAMRQLDDQPLLRRIIAKQIVRTVVTLIHPLKVLASLSTTRKKNRDNVSFKNKLKISFKLGTLRQLIIEFLSIQSRNTVYDRRYNRDE